MNCKLFFGVLVGFLIIDVTSSQRSGLIQYLRRILSPPTRRIHITRSAPVLTSAGAGGLAGIGMGGVIGGGGLFGGTVGVPQQRTFRRPTATMFTTNPSEDAIQRAAMGLGVPVRTVDISSIDSSSDMRAIGPGGSQMLVDRPDPADPIDILYAPRSMVKSARDAARLQRMSDTDAVVLV